MSTFTIAYQPGLAKLVTLKGLDKNNSGPMPLGGVTVTLTDGTNAYIAAAGPTGGLVPLPQFWIVPRQNVPGGTPLASVVTLTLNVNGIDPILGGTLPMLTLTCDLQIPPAPPNNTTQLVLAADLDQTPTVLPLDPGTLTINLT